MRLLIRLLAACLAFAAPSILSAAPQKTKAEGADILIHGEGADPGKFLQISDLAFDRTGTLHVLEGVAFDKKANAWIGNARVQRFNQDGKFLGEFSVRNSELKEQDVMSRLAIDSTGRVYVSKADASAVEQYSAEGKRLRSISIPGATGLCIWKDNGVEKLAVLGGHSAVVNRKRVMLGGDAIQIVDPETGAVERAIPLSQPLLNVQMLTTDAAGRFLVLADVNQLYVFDPIGKLVEKVGSGVTKPRSYEGSQLSEALAIDSKGTMIASGWGDPVRFDTALETITRRPGRFNIGNGWGQHVRFAFDPSDRLWVAVQAPNPAEANRANQFFLEKPAVMRLASNFYDADQPNRTESSVQLIGFHPLLETSIPYDVAHEIGAFPLQLSIAGAARRVTGVDVHFRVLDVFGTQVDEGKFAMPLPDEKETKHSFSVNLPRFGWYTVITEFGTGGKPLMSEAKFIGATPKYAGMDAGPQSKNSWVDPVRQMYTGLPFMRLHAGKSLNTLDAEIAAAKAAGANFIVQLSNIENCQPDYVREVVTRFKGRIAIYELFNEPNISLKGGLDAYIEIWKSLAPLIKGIDPQAKLMGPATVNIDLKWIDGFFAACAPLVDFVSIHDYEGHNTYDPNHWIWKIGELRKLMAKYGLEGKELWQTERATSGVARQNFMGLHQSVILTFHYDLLETLGIPPAHNMHYYLNQGGYVSVPTYVWSKSGPHPAALALRTRYAQTRDREYLGKIDFGPNGNKVFMGLRYGPRDGDGGLIVLRNLGTLDTPLTAKTTGSAEACDAFDNPIATANGGALNLVARQLPTYIKLPAKAQIDFPKWDWGKNFAAEAKFTYTAESLNPAAPEVPPVPANGTAPASATTAPAPTVVSIEPTPEDQVPNPNNLARELLTSDPFKILVNGIMETHHQGNPHGGTGKAPQFRGDASALPQTLEIAFPTARPISRMAIFSERGDNGFCALLDYDLQALQAGEWKTLAEIRTPLPVSTAADSEASTTLTWMQDPNFFVHQFSSPVTTDRLRVIVRRTSFGFAPDDGLRGWSKMLKPSVMLKEIEIY